MQKNIQISGAIIASESLWEASGLERPSCHLQYLYRPVLAEDLGEKYRAYQVQPITANTNDEPRSIVSKVEVIGPRVINYTVRRFVRRLLDLCK